MRWKRVQRQLSQMQQLLLLLLIRLAAPPFKLRAPHHTITPAATHHSHPHRHMHRHRSPSLRPSSLHVAAPHVAASTAAADLPSTSVSDALATPADAHPASKQDTGTIATTHVRWLQLHHDQACAPPWHEKQHMAHSCCAVLNDRIINQTSIDSCCLIVKSDIKCWHCYRYMLIACMCCALAHVHVPNPCCPCVCPLASSSQIHAIAGYAPSHAHTCWRATPLGHPQCIPSVGRG